MLASVVGHADRAPQTPLTTFGNLSPRNACFTRPAAASRRRVTAAVLADAMWLCTMTLGMLRNGVHPENPNELKVTELQTVAAAGWKREFACQHSLE